MTRLERLRAAPVTVALTAVNVVVFLFAELHGSTTDAATLLRFGAVEPHHVWAGEYWRLGTYMFLHIGWTHLLWNTYASFGWCTTLERELGHARFLAVYLLGGLVGGAATTVLDYPVSAGASGAMFGMVGGALALRARTLPSLSAAWTDPPTRSTLGNIAVWTVIGMTALPMNNRAHLGGLAGGALATWVLTAARPRPGKIAYGVGLAALLVAATHPWELRRERAALPAPAAATPDESERVFERCGAHDLAACHAYAITAPPAAGDTTRELEGFCELTDVDACAAWGWTLAHGRPGVARDAARGAALLHDACVRGSAWGCAMEDGATPIEALDRRGATLVAKTPDGERCAIDGALPFFTRLRPRLTEGTTQTTRLGTFRLERYPAYEGRNPRTGAPVAVPAKDVVHFLASDELAARAFARPDAALPKRPATPEDVACSDDELGSVVEALRRCGKAEVPGFGTLTAHGGEVRLHRPGDTSEIDDGR